jgi:hypothetical protein
LAFPASHSGNRTRPKHAKACPYRRFEEALANFSNDVLVMPWLDVPHCHDDLGRQTWKEARPFFTEFMANQRLQPNKLKRKGLETDSRPCVQKGLETEVWA